VSRTALVAIAFVALGCATTMAEPELEARLARVAAESAPPGTARRVFPVWAGTRLAALTLLADARGDPRSGESLRLGQAFARGASRPTTVVVGGPYPDLSERIVLNALELQRERGVPKLTIVLVGPEAPSAALEAAAAAAGARLRHRPLE
jgi:hypothetical protein